MDALIAQFEAANPGIKVKHTHFPYAQYRTKTAAAVPAGEGPAVMQLFFGWMREYAKSKLIQPLPARTFNPAEIDRDYFEFVRMMKTNDGYWAIPTAVRSLGLFYNKKLAQRTRAHRMESLRRPLTKWSRTLSRSPSTTAAAT